MSYIYSWWESVICWCDYKAKQWHEQIINMYEYEKNIGISIRPRTAMRSLYVLWLYCRQACRLLYDNLCMTTYGIWNAKVDFSCYNYFVGHIFICWCILFFLVVVVAHIYLFLPNLRFIYAVFICRCILFCSLLVFSLSMLTIIRLVLFSVRRVVSHYVRHASDIWCR